MNRIKSFERCRTRFGSNLPTVDEERKCVECDGNLTCSVGNECDKGHGQYEDPGRVCD